MKFTAKIMKKFKVEKVDSFTGHQDCVYSLAKSPIEGRFFSASGDGTVVEWRQDIPDLGTPIVKVHNSVYAIELHGETGELWVGHNFEGVHVVDPVAKKSLKSIQLNKAAIFDIKFAENLAFIGGGDGVLSIIDVDEFVFKKHLKASDKSVRSIDINTETREIAAAYSDHKIRIFSLDDFQLKTTLVGHENSVFSVKYVNDGKLLVSGSRDAKLIGWDVANSYKKSNEVNAHLFAINDIVTNPNGDLLATCSMDKSIKIWDAETLKLLKVIDRGRHAGHGTSINKLLWTSFNNQLLSCSDDRTISAWEITEI